MRVGDWAKVQAKRGKNFRRYERRYRRHTPAIKDPRTRWEPQYSIGQRFSLDQLNDWFSNPRHDRGSLDAIMKALHALVPSPLLSGFSVKKI